MGVKISTINYRSEIDGLRALAVLPVIFFHAGFSWFKGGFVGVDIFFVISGYLITTIIISQIAADKFSIVNFYERRARRILPALFFVMVVCIPFSVLWLNPFDLKDFGQSLIAASTFSSNILFWWESGYFDAAAEHKPLLHTWSLAVEEQFYIFFPVILILFWHHGLKRILIFLSILLIASLASAHFSSVNSSSASFYLIPTRVWELLVGSFVAFYLNSKKPEQPNLSKEILSLLGFSMITFSIVMFDKTTPFPSFYTLIPVIGTALIILFAVPKTALHYLLSFKPLVTIGLISYSAYLWHQPILAFAKHRLFDEVTEVLLINLCIISLVLGWFTWKFIEKPFRNQLFLTRKFFFALIVFSISVFVFIGLLMHLYSEKISERNPNFDYGLWDSWSKLDKDRRTRIYAGECQFNGIDGLINIDDFIQNHSCKPNKINKDTILIFGDSVSADAAQSVRYLTGNIIQLGGAGCSILPNEECKEIYIKLTELLSSGVTKVMLANHITEEAELSAKYLNKVEKFYSNYDISTILLPPPLIFKKINCPFFKYCSDEAPYTEEYYKLDNKLIASSHFYIAPAFALGCMKSPQLPSRNFCENFYSHSKENIFLRTDGFHLNKNGAKLYAEYIADVIRQRWGMDLKLQDNPIAKLENKYLDE